MEPLRGVRRDLVLDREVRPPCLAVLAGEFAAHDVPRCHLQLLEPGRPDPDGDPEPEQEEAMDGHGITRDGQIAQTGRLRRRQAVE